MKIISTVVLLLALASTSTADTRRDFWNRFVSRKFAQAEIQQQGDATCPVAPRTFACKSARLETERKHQYIHVCPKDGDGMLWLHGVIAVIKHTNFTNECNKGI